MQTNEIGCVLMASGMGVRFGGNKLMAPFRGKPVISYILSRTEALGVPRIVVTRSRDTEAFCQSVGIPVLFHALPNRNDTVRLGLSALLKQYPGLKGCLFCPCDMPLLKLSTLQGICALGGPDTIVRPYCGSVPGSPVLFGSTFFNELLTLPEKNGGGAVIKRHAGAVVPYAVADMRELTDIDTQAVLQELEALPEAASL